MIKPNNGLHKKDFDLHENLYFSFNTSYPHYKSIVFSIHVITNLTYQIKFLSSLSFHVTTRNVAQVLSRDTERMVLLKYLKI